MIPTGSDGRPGKGVEAAGMVGIVLAVLTLALVVLPFVDPEEVDPGGPAATRTATITPTATTPTATRTPSRSGTPTTTSSTPTTGPSVPSRTRPDLPVDVPQAPPVIKLEITVAAASPGSSSSLIDRLISVLSPLGTLLVGVAAVAALRTTRATRPPDRPIVQQQDGGSEPSEPDSVGPRQG